MATVLDAFFDLFRSRTAPESDEQRAHRLALMADLTFEVIPLKSLEDAITSLPPAARVSVTVSPAKGLAVTQETCERLLSAGYRAIPHISARMVRDRAHTRELARWMRSAGVSTMFLVAGDAEEPGEYPDAPAFLRDLLDTDHGLSTIGVTAYPDSHPLIGPEVLHRVLHAKQQLLTDAGIAGYCSTQMCFDAELIKRWLRREREAGMQLPVHLGIAGVVDRAKLLTMGVRLGIGQSLAYLRKNRHALTKMMTTVSYDPDDLLVPLSSELATLGVEGLHVFTFNQVEATARWQARTLGS